jgi:hypothetical protein
MRVCGWGEWRWLAAVILGVATCAMVGCGDGRPKRVRAAGRVLIDGKPVEYGFVQVVPEGDRPATGKIGPGGAFRLTTYDENDGVVPGRHRAAVIAVEPLGAASQKWHVPKKYGDSTTAGLEIEVNEPTDSLEINLTWDGGQPFVERFGQE